MVLAFHCPTRIVHGVGALETLGANAAAIGMTRPMVVTDPIIAATDACRVALDSLAAAGIDCLVFDGAAVDARVSHIHAQAARARAEKVDGIVGIGGGSAMCTAKGIACMATNEGRFTDFRGHGRVSRPPLPSIMAPTTAGSGSEVSIGAIAYDEDSETKFAVLSPLLYPRIAILDPMALETVPEALGVESGMDALAHATEAWLSASASPPTDALAEHALRALARCVGPAMRDRDSAAMADQLLAAAMAVIAFENAGVGLAHVLGRPLEGIFHVTHGRSVGTLLPAVVALAARAMPGRVVALGAILADGGPRWGDPAREAVAQIEALYDRLGFPAAFDSAVVDPDRVGEMARRAHVIQELGVPDIGAVTDDTVIRAANGASISVGDAAALYRRCIAR